MFNQNLSALASNPPIPLVETYYKCTSTVYDAIFNSIGIAFGNTGTFEPIVIILLFPLFYYLHEAFFKPQNDEADNCDENDQFSEEALLDVSKRLSRLIIMSKYGNNKLPPNSGVLRSLLMEINEALEADTIDSDDELNEDIYI